MKKRILTAFTVILTAVFTAGGLTACTPPHRYAKNWSYNETEHWREITCIHKTMVDVQKEPHSFDGNFCTVCGYYRITEGLYYTANYGENEEVVSYTLSGMGSAIGYYVGVPEYYQGKPVTKIENAILRYADELVIPKTVTAIDTDNSYGNRNYYLTHITVVPDNKTYSSRDGILYNKEQTEIVFIPKVSGDITIPEGITSLPDSAFFGCNELTGISLPNSLKSVGRYAFTHCNKLNYTADEWLKYLGDDSNPYRILVGIKEFAENYYINEQTEIIAGGVFEGGYVAEITIPEKVISIGDYAFSGCENLTQVVLPQNLKEIGYSAFRNCINLQKINIPSKLEKIIATAFDGCNSLELKEYDNAYYLGNDENPYLMLYRVKDNSISECEISPNAKFIYGQAFYYCGWLTEITVPDSVSFLGEAAFSNCTYLENATLPDSIAELPAYAFNECNSLTSIILPENLISIDSYAFGYCYNLKEIALPVSLKKIALSAFNGCTKLHDIYYGGTVSQWQAIEKKQNNGLYTGNATIHCTDGNTKFMK